MPIKPILMMPTETGNAIGGFFGQYGFMLIMLAALVAMLVFTSRSNKKRQQQYKDMIDALKPGTRVRTIGGIYGTVTSVKDDVIFVSVGPDKVRLVFTRQAIASIEDGPIEATIDGDIVDNSKK